MADVHVRVATVADAEAMRSIYAPYIEQTAISFEAEVPSVEQMRERISARLPMYPWLVAEVDQPGTRGIVGYAYASRFAPRDAYLWSVESSLYVSQDHPRSGVGSVLYDQLISTLRRQRFRMVYAGIAMPNAPSVAFHEAKGFHHSATFENAGFKFGNWHDVGWWALDLQPPPDTAAPKAPIPFADLK